MLKHRVVLIDIVDPHHNQNDALKNLQELKSLVATYNGIDVVNIIQHRSRPDKATFIGSGKVVELARIVKEKQIEIARMYHMGPRIYGLGENYFSRQGGGANTKGQGETNIELMKRHWREQIKIKKDQLEKISGQHLTQLERRKTNNITAISIVGYTNAGKTSLFNLLTKKHKVVKDTLFVTLDSVTGKFYFPMQKKEATISDTIGFIKDLPSSLINSFKSTLMESIHADLLLHVIDISDPEMNEKIRIVEKILQELQIHSKKIIFVFNKVDAFIGDGQKIIKEIKEKYSQFSPVFISVTTDYGIDKLKNQIEKELF